ncbi:signal transduction histidine kinase [Stackebrandtia endophytica]|uniref:Signal transduction histidine kinase n=2 Tax=Stackebrandtia endophytica TaxID=1496996 RepID=A0A543APY5_9ACTN|nr:signal transduction histidine kinase [Stackebrandtia endophytica]
MAPGRRAGRRADAVAGYAFMGLSLGVGGLTLIMGDTAIPVWMWAGILVAWTITVNLSINDRFNRTGQRLLYAGALLTSWVLLATTTDSGSMMVILLIVVAVVGTHLIPLRWVWGVVLLNSLVAFGHMHVNGADPTTSAVYVAFYLIIHLAMVFSAYAMLRETQLRAELEQKNLELEAAGVLLEDAAASAERLRISRELHDLIGHQLTVLNLDLEAAKHRDGAAGRNHVDRARVVAKELLTDVRGTVGRLRRDSPGDLRQSLERLAGAVPSLDIHVAVAPGIDADEVMTEALVRAAQEIITNTIKHAEATELLLTVTTDGDVLALSGTNDGTPPRTITPGHGLTGLRERLELLGGRLAIHTTPQFTVDARLPMTHDRRLRT